MKRVLWWGGRLLATGICLLAGHGFGAPANDNFADRTVLDGTDVTFSGSNAGATTEPGEPEWNGSYLLLQTVWLSWTAPADGAVFFTLVGEGWVPECRLYTGGMLHFLQYETNTLANPFNMFAARVRGGTTYQAVIGTVEDGSGELSAGDFTAHLVFVPVPTDDAFAQRVALGAGATNFVASNYAASAESDEPGLPGVQQPERNVWWSWAPETSGPVTLTVTSATNDVRPFCSDWAMIAVYTGTNLESLRNVAGRFGNISEWYEPGGFQFSFEAVAGSEKIVGFWIAGGGYSAAAGTLTTDHYLLVEVDERGVVQSCKLSSRWLLPTTPEDLFAANGWRTTAASDTNEPARFSGPAFWFPHTDGFQQLALSPGENDRGFLELTDTAIRFRDRTQHPDTAPCLFIRYESLTECRLAKFGLGRRVVIRARDQEVHSSPLKGTT